MAYRSSFVVAYLESWRLVTEPQTRTGLKLRRVHLDLVALPGPVKVTFAVFLPSYRLEAFVEYGAGTVALAPHLREVFHESIWIDGTAAERVLKLHQPMAAKLLHDSVIHFKASLVSLGDGQSLRSPCL
jgi:hypothetical protein